MSVHHSAQTHQTLISRMPQVTGQAISHWLNCLETGPGLLRFEERVVWLRDEHEIPHSYATAIVHEHDLRRGALRL
jgi:Domain of unknown function (DUF4287)